jgi:hypothetical protein
MTRFYLYAGRVKHIIHRRSVGVHPDLLSFLMARHSGSIFQHAPILPNVRTVQMSYPIHSAFQASLSLSEELRHLQIDLGFKSRSFPLFNGDVLLQYLDDVVRLSPHLETVIIRGLATKCLNGAISRLKDVKVLSLRLGVSLTLDTLSAVTSFPALLEFDVQASHFNVKDLDELFYDRISFMFPSLQRLRIRARAPVIELFLRAIPDGSLQTLHVELDDPADTIVSWDTMFNLICIKAANTLQSLTIERHTEIDDLGPDIIDSTNTHPIAYNNTLVDHIPNVQFTNLQMLAGLHQLRKFVLDISPSASIGDHELDLLLCWWPELEHLDLGSAPIPPCVYPSAQQSLSSHSLVTIAKKTTKLTSLVLPVDITWAHDVSMTDLPRQLVLTRLTCGYPFPPSRTGLEVAMYLHRLFPSLQVVDGLSEHEDQWSQTQAALKLLTGQRCDDS